jgi:hypothetical protein
MNGILAQPAVGDHGDTPSEFLRLIACPHRPLCAGRIDSRRPSARPLPPGHQPCESDHAEEPRVPNPKIASTPWVTCWVTLNVPNVTNGARGWNWGESPCLEKTQISSETVGVSQSCCVQTCSRLVSCDLVIANHPPVSTPGAGALFGYRAMVAWILSLKRLRLQKGLGFR